MTPEEEYLLYNGDQMKRDALARKMNNGASIIPTKADTQAVNPNRRNLIGDMGTPSPEEQAAAAYMDAGGKGVRDPQSGVSVVPPEVLTAKPMDPMQARVAKAKAAGYTDEQIQEYFKKKYPQNYERPDATGSFLENAAAGAGGRMVELYRGGKQLLGIDKENNQKAIDEAKRLDEQLKGTGGGMVGSMVTDALLTAPVGAGLGAVGSKVAGEVIPGVVSRAAQAAPWMKTAMIPATGAAAGAAQSAIEPVASDETQMEKTLWGAGGGAAGNIAGRAVGRVITPFQKENATRKQLADTLARHDVPISAGQGTNSPTLQTFEAALNSIPGVKSVMTAGSPRQAQAYTKALAKELSSDADRLTPDVVERLGKDIGKPFEKLGKANSGTLDTDFEDAVARATEKVRQAENVLGRAPGKEAVEAAAGRIVQGDPLTGAEYNLARSHLTGEASRAARASDTPKAEVMRDLRQAYDDFAQRAWGAQGAWDPGVATDIGKARARWGHLDDLTKQGVLTEDGLVNPQKLKAIVTAMNPKAMASGAPTDEFNGLVRAAGLLKSGGPDSGTARNYMIAKMLAGGGLAGVYGWDRPEDAAVGVGGVGAALLATQTPWGRKYLMNQLMTTDKGKEAASLIRKGMTGVGQGRAQAILSGE